MRGFLPWQGGKSQLAGQIAQMINLTEHLCYVEPFMGAAHVFFHKEPAKVEVLNDINRDLSNLFRILQHHLEEFLRQFKWMLSSRDLFELLNAQNPESLTDIQRAARFYYLQKLCFGGKATSKSYGTSTTSPPRLNLLRIEEELSQVHLRLIRTNIENLSWQKAIEKYDRPHTLFYLDPPYYGCENDYGKDLFSKADFKEMAGILKGIKGKFILSLNDHPEVRKLFKDFQIKPVSVRYSLNNTKGQAKAFPELLISSMSLKNIEKIPAKS